jgi:glucuronate isomerase
MTSFITDDFLLESDCAKTLYHDYAANNPIIDYHNHLPPDQVASNHRFPDLHAIWLAGDHYKWRAMRANGVPENLITGNAAPYEKFLAFACTAPKTLRNPLYHWTHLELVRYFGITELLDESTAPRVWAQANEKLASPEFTTRGLLDKFKVVAVCTTDDPSAPLPHHESVAAETELPFRMYPTFRPDGAFRVDQPELLNPWITNLEKTAACAVASLDDLKTALSKRHDDFHKLGGRLSDHGLQSLGTEKCSADTAQKIFANALAGIAATPADTAAFTVYMLEFCAALDANRGWTKQLHIGALRNANTRMRAQLGPDTGYDSIAPDDSTAGVARFLDALEQQGKLPKIILYNLNPAQNYAYATLIGSFMDGRIPGKIQYGSGWWFLDQLEGMTLQINALSACGLLSRFVGMLTDSRSFLSFPRHEYFRRLLCQIVGNDMERGLLPRDCELVGGMVRDICFNNAKEYFGLVLP